MSRKRPSSALPNRLFRDTKSSVKRANPDLSRQLMQVIKTQVKAEGLTQAQLALELGISLTTMKRWYTGQGLGLTHLCAILKVIDLSFEEVAALLPSEASPYFEYSLQQEQYFVRHPSVLAYFDRLLAGESPKKIERTFSLSAAGSFRYLRRLEKLGLIELHPNNHVKLKVRGEPRWKKKGPLASFFRKSAIGEFISQSHNLRMGIHRIQKADRKKIEEKIEALQAFSLAAEKRAKHSKETVSYGLLLGFSPFRWSVLQLIKE